MKSGILKTEIKTLVDDITDELTYTVKAYFSKEILGDLETLDNQVCVERIHDEEGGTRLWITVGVFYHPATMPVNEETNAAGCKGLEEVHCEGCFKQTSQCAGTDGNYLDDPDAFHCWGCKVAKVGKKIPIGQNQNG